MKKTKILTMALAVGTLASSAFADYRVNIIGSTAYRKDCYAALKTFYGTGLAANYPYGFGGTTQGANGDNGSTNLVWSGTVNGQIVTIKCYWAGSAGGIGATSDSIQQSGYLNNPPANSSDYEAASALTVPDFAFSDVSQSSTFYTRAGTDISLTALSGGAAIIPFIWAKGISTATGWANITNIATGKGGQVAAALAGGGMNLAQLTGTAADEVNGFVYVVGRDDDSGTRTISLIDSGYGFKTPVQQYDVFSGSPADVEPHTDPNPDSAVTGNLGGGYAAGSQVKAALNVDITGATSTTNGLSGPIFTIGYLGLADANGLTHASNGVAGQWLTYNGVAYTTNSVNEGQYTLWTREQFYARPATLTDPNLGNVTGGFYKLFTPIVKTNQSPANGTLPLTGLKVTRNADGGAISHN
jgi:hypothetical protein